MGSPFGALNASNQAFSGMPSELDGGDVLHNFDFESFLNQTMT